MITKLDCKKFSEELQGQIVVSTETMCTVSRMREFDVTIHDHPSKSPLVLAAMFSFEYDMTQDEEGNEQGNEEGIKDGIALCLGETVVLQDEISMLEGALKTLGSTVTALHNHWLYTDPPIYYMHWLSFEHPTTFSMKMNRIFTMLKL